uniref:Uncharacterized protein K0007B01.30 n=1 Tax=Oryza sativa subsp. indica TaxID=39946 RepID=C8TET4_ORYSI|nr:hypothetical protein [Oryza sativa Indica Group]BAI39761.1 hypothetical protein [Oryza sativa Indica Group]
MDFMVVKKQLGGRVDMEVRDVSGGLAFRFVAVAGDGGRALLNAVEVVLVTEERRDPPTATSCLLSIRRGRRWWKRPIATAMVVVVAVKVKVARSSTYEVPGIGAD